MYGVIGDQIRSLYRGADVHGSMEKCHRQTTDKPIRIVEVSVGYEYRGDLTTIKYLSAISLRAGRVCSGLSRLLKNTPFKRGYTVE